MDAAIDLGSTLHGRVTVEIEGWYALTSQGGPNGRANSTSIRDMINLIWEMQAEPTTSFMIETGITSFLDPAKVPSEEEFSELVDQTTILSSAKNHVVVRNQELIAAFNRACLSDEDLKPRLRGMARLRELR